MLSLRPLCQLRAKLLLSIQLAGLLDVEWSVYLKIRCSVIVEPCMSFPSPMLFRTLLWGAAPLWQLDLRMGAHAARLLRAGYV